MTNPVEFHSATRPEVVAATISFDVGAYKHKWRVLVADEVVCQIWDNLGMTERAFDEWCEGGNAFVRSFQDGSDAVTYAADVRDEYDRYLRDVVGA